MAARHKARKRALDVLFQAEARGVEPLDVLVEMEGRRAEDGDAQLNPYTAELVRGVVDHRDRIDELISTYSLGWALDRMPAVDRAILRIGAYELLWGDVPDAVVLDESTGLARELSTDDSPGFVNGLLARIAGLRSTLDLEA